LRLHIKKANLNPAISEGGKVIIVVDISENSEQGRLEKKIQVWDETRGAWGHNQSLDVLNRELNNIRSDEWKRDWEI
jgi:hypothetical protein